MAEKRSKTILSGLKNMLHLDSEKPSKPAPKKAAAPKKTASAEKRPAPAQKPKEQPAAAPAEAAASPGAAASDAAAEPKPDKKQVKQQPWYRHRQRW